MSRTQPPVVKIAVDGAGYRATSPECPGLSVWAPTYGLAEAEGNSMVLDFRQNPTAAAPRLVTSPSQITGPPPGSLPPQWVDHVPSQPPEVVEWKEPESSTVELTLADVKAAFGVVEGADVPEHPDDIPADKPRRGRPPNPPKVP
jgi:hypothetical protein